MGKRKQMTTEKKVRQPSVWSYAGVNVYFYPELDDRGGVLAPEFVQAMKNRRDFFHPRYQNIFEWSSGPAFIGFALLSSGFCETLCLADSNPLVIECIEKTIFENNLEDKVSYYHITSVSELPDDEQFDLVIGNPPNYCNVNIEHNFGRQFFNDPRAVDKDWVHHQDFYQHIKKYLRPGAHICISEIEPFLKQVFIPYDDPTPYDDRPDVPLNTFKNMIAKGHLRYVDALHYFTFPGHVKAWLMLAKNID